MNLGSWLIIEYEDKYYVGIAMEKSDDDHLVQVRCLEKPFGSEDPQNLEKERLSIFYSEDKLYQSPVVLPIISFNRSWKYCYKLD